MWYFTNLPVWFLFIGEAMASFPASIFIRWQRHSLVWIRVVAVVISCFKVASIYQCAHNIMQRKRSAEKGQIKGQKNMRKKLSSQLQHPIYFLQNQKDLVFDNKSTFYSYKQQAFGGGKEILTRLFWSCYNSIMKPRDNTHIPRDKVSWPPNLKIIRGNQSDFCCFRCCSYPIRV